MEMTPTPYLHLLHLVLPETVVVITAILVLAADLAIRQRSTTTRLWTSAVLSTLGCTASALLIQSGMYASTMDDMFVTTPVIAHVKVALLALVLLTIILSIETHFTEHIGEYVLLLLLATTGMMFLVSSRNLLTTFVSLEMLSLALYAMVAFGRDNVRVGEAALKYFLFGAMSAAFLLFGFSLLYGLTNATAFTLIGCKLAGNSTSPLLAVAMVTTIIGLGFKVAAAPFHFWAPDVYEGAPNPIAAFIASSSKVASFFVLFQLVVTLFESASGSAAWMHMASGWTPLIAFVAALSIVLGNLGALAQIGMRRLLAYSAIANSGYMLIAVVAHSSQSLGALLYYVVTYSLGTLGAFAVVAVVEQNAGSDAFANFDGLSRRAPLLSASFFIFLLSQAGIPPLAGFFAKFYLFSAALRATGSMTLLWLVVLAIAMSAVSLYYYLKVLKRVYVADPPENAAELSISMSTQVIVAILALGVLLTGAIPEPILKWFSAAG
jgi:NADH-quinone oxidoreductase subunit N